jgi:cleavage and polyadenylation specificity factor subunit 1
MHRVQIFQLPNLSEPVCSFEGFGFLPPVLSSGFVPRRTTGKETLMEIIVADIGDEVEKSTYLIVSYIVLHY